MKRIYKILLSILVLVSLIFSCSPNLKQLTQQYPIVYNSHNVNEIVDLYSDDVIFEVVGQFSLNGKDQIRDITRYDSVLNIKMSVSNIEPIRDSVFCNLSETNDWLQIAEIGEAQYAVIFVFRDGLISKISASA